MPAHLVGYFEQQLKGHNPCKISARGVLGSYLMSIIEEAPKPAPDPENYIEVAIPDRDKHGPGYDGRYSFVKINEVGLQRFHRFVELLMQKELFAELDVIVERGEAQRRGGKMTEAIERFIAKYSSESTVLSIDALRKSYYRHRQRGESLVNKLV